MQKIL